MNGKGKTTTANDPSPLIPLPLGRGEGGDFLRATYYKHGAKNVASTECPQGEGKRKAGFCRRQVHGRNAFAKAKGGCQGTYGKAAADSRTAMRYVKDGERVFRFFIKSFFSGFLSVGS